MLDVRRAGGPKQRGEHVTNPDHPDYGECCAYHVERRAVIEQAKGQLMLTLHVDEQQAFELLRAESQHTNTKLRDVAARIVRLSLVGGAP